MSSVALASDKISTFPSSMRSTDVYSRFTTERNLVNMVSGLVTDGYVRECDSANANSPIEFVLGGYTFRVDKWGDILTALYGGAAPSDKTISAYILVGYSQTAGIGAKIGDSRLVGWNGAVNSSVDLNSSFVGVNFTDEASPSAISTVPSGFNGRWYILPLLSNVGGSWKVPDGSYQRFETLSTSEVDEIVDSTDPLES